MTLEEVELMQQTGLLYLEKARRKSHFDAAITFRFVAVIPVLTFIVLLIKEGTKYWLILSVICCIIASVFLLISYTIYRAQRNKLKLISFATGKTQEENYRLSKKVIETLQWTISKDSQNFIEAYNPHKDIRTWGNEMISIILLNEKILLNSICNLDTMNQIAFTFGKNKQNIDKFIQAFQLFSQLNQTT